MQIDDRENIEEEKAKVEAELDALGSGEFNLDDLIEDEPQQADEQASGKEESSEEVSENIENEEKPSKRWQKRIDKVTFQAREAERQAKAQRIENEQLQKRLVAIESKQHENNVEDFKNEYHHAKSQLEAAIEQGDTGRQIELQEKIADMRAQARIMDMQNAEAERQYQKRERVQTQHVPEVTNEAKAWASRNPWFFDPSNQNKQSYARFIDQQLTNAGYDPNSKEYFDELDRQINSRFTSTEETDTIQSNSYAKPNVGKAAPKTSRRSSSKKTLTPEQAKIAKELGLTTKEAINAYLDEINKAKG